MMYCWICHFFEGAQELQGARGGGGQAKATVGEEANRDSPFQEGKIQEADDMNHE